MSNIADLGKLVKQKYPGTYDDLNDAVLGQLMKQKFPGSYDDFADSPNLPNLGMATGISGPLTPMQKAVNVARATIQMIPEAAGALLMKKMRL